MRCIFAQLGGRIPAGQSPLIPIAAHNDTLYQRLTRDGHSLGVGKPTQGSHYLGGAPGKIGLDPERCMASPSLQ